MTKRKKRRDGYVIFCYVFLMVLGLVLLYPLFYALFASLSTQEAIDANPAWPAITDVVGGIRNYGVLFTADGLIFSVLITLARILLYVVILLFTSVLGGFVFAKREFPGKNVLFMAMMISTMIPGVALTVPSYVFNSKFPLVGGNNILGQGGSGFINNPALLFVTGWISVYNIFLCRQMISTQGGELGEAAEIDGAGFLREVFLIYFPLLKPVCAVIVLNLAVGMWGDFMTSYVYLPDLPQWDTLGKKVSDLMDFYLNPNQGDGVDIPGAFAVSMVALVPPVILFLFLQKSFIEGLSLGGVKG